MSGAMTTATFNNKTPKSLNWRHLVFPCTVVDTMADSSQLTQGGSKVRWPCQSTIVGVACAELRHSDRNLRTAWFKKEDFKIGIKKEKNTGWILIIIGWMCTQSCGTHESSDSQSIQRNPGGPVCFLWVLPLPAVLLPVTDAQAHSWPWALRKYAFPPLNWMHWSGVCLQTGVLLAEKTPEDAQLE